MKRKFIQGFSKLNRTGKIAALENQLAITDFSSELDSYRHPENQAIFDEISENTLTNFYLPWSIAPNFLINGEIFHVPMVIEESSVVAAASAGAKFWAANGGFKTRVISSLKTGQVHFTWSGNKDFLKEKSDTLRHKILEGTLGITGKMKERGGGILSVELDDATSDIPMYFRINVKFGTGDAMGANFINTTLEKAAGILKDFLDSGVAGEGTCEIIMAILSNYTPECLVECRIDAPVSAFDKIDGEMAGENFCRKFETAVQIAEKDISRAVTHNKGIMNGVDAVILATGNDFRAIEAGVHAYASHKGYYSSLSQAECSEGIFSLSLVLPLALGTTGGLTRLHPMAAKSLEILGMPDAPKLMQIAASAGMANHFSAIKALITKGIQTGHMKMHLTNILNQLGATAGQKDKAREWFHDKPVSVAAVSEFLAQIQ